MPFVCGLVGALAMFGCGDNPVSMDMGMDMTVVIVDMTPPPDLTMFDFKGVTCGNATCDPMSQACCVVPMGMTFQSMCMPTGSCQGDGGVILSCDGPEDCMGGNNCCVEIGGSGGGDAGALMGSGAATCSMGCKTATGAPDGMGGFMARSKLCHLKSDCAGYTGTALGMNLKFDSCCHSDMAGPYKFCAPSIGAGAGGYMCD